MRQRYLTLLALLSLLLGVGSSVHAQSSAGLSAWTASRSVLEQRLTALEGLVASTAYSEQMRARARREVEDIRRRLSEGDFRIGDRIFVELEATALSGTAAIPTQVLEVRDTVTVLSGSRIVVRGVGEIALAGVLRSELQGRINTAVNEVVLNARSSARPLVRIAVFGSVARPGFFIVPMESRLDDVVMLAGGPVQDAASEQIRVVRGDTVVLSSAEVQSMIANGVVIGEMGIQEGDNIYVSRGRQRLDRQQTLQFTFLFLSPLLSGLIFRVLR